MALQPIKKVCFFAGNGNDQHLLRLLQDSGVVQLTTAEKILPENDLQDYGSGDDERTGKELSELKRKLQTAENYVALLEKLEDNPGLIGRFLHPREMTTADELQQMSNFNIDQVSTQIEELQDREAQLQGEVQQARYMLQQLRPIAFWRADLQQFTITAKTFSILLRVPDNELHETCNQLQSLLGDESFIRRVNEEKPEPVILVVARRVRHDEFVKFVDNQTAEVLQLQNLSGSAAENIDRLRRQLAIATGRLQTLRREYRRFLKDLPALRRFCDYLQNRIDCLKHRALLRKGQYTVLVSGWIPTNDIPALEEQIENAGIDAAMAIQEPGKNDVPPVCYQNPALVKPFEFVTDLYSRPLHWEIDPTPFIGIFFALFFGICLTDAGYGLLITLAAWWSIKKLPTLSAGSARLIRILFYGGIATTFVGLLTGGVFGIPAPDLPPPLHHLQSLTVLNPMQEQMNFLIFTLILGIIHVTFGILLKFHWQIKHGQRQEAWLDQAPWLVIILGVVILIAASLVDQTWLSSFGYILMSAAALVILFYGGRNIKNPFARLGMGAFSLYQVTGLFGDVLSYARLFALGIATGVIAGVVNFLAEMTLGIPYIGFVIMPIVLIAGHALNLAINTLGGFIHTTRLQFVEFFGKFYEGGGEPFDPFRLKLKYTIIKERE